MKFQYCSDLHLEFPDNYDLFIKEKKLKPAADNLIIAGDLAYLKLVTEDKCDTTKVHIKYEDRFDDAIQYLSDNWKNVIIIPGNHEYYGEQAPSMHNMQYCRQFRLKSNVTLIEKSSIRFEDDNCVYTIAGGTMWTVMPAEDMYYVEQKMNDYRRIRYDDDYKFNGGYAARDCANFAYAMYDILGTKEYRDSLANRIFFENTDNERKGILHKAIIVSHHCPIEKGLKNWYQIKNCGPWQRDMAMQMKHGYYCDMSKTIKKIQPDVWIYGHTHATNKIKCGNTQFLENSMGYVAYGHNDKFGFAKTFEI
jgi:Icc-related predicted phosphoesterase